MFEPYMTEFSPSVFSQACKGDRDIQVGGGGGGGRRKPSAYLMQIYAKIILYDNWMLFMLGLDQLGAEKNH